MMGWDRAIEFSGVYRALFAERSTVELRDASGGPARPLTRHPVWPKRTGPPARFVCRRPPPRDSQARLKPPCP